MSKKLSFKKPKELVLRLAEQQKKLKNAIQKDFDSSELDNFEFQNQMLAKGVNRRYFKANRWHITTIILPGKFLDIITEHLNCPAVAEEIKEICGNLTSTRIRLLAFFSEETINLYFDILELQKEAKLKYGKKMTLDAFCSIFNEQKDLIKGFLTGNKESVKEIDENQNARDTILSILCKDDWNHLIEDMITNENNLIGEKTTELQSLFIKYFPECRTHEMMAKKLDMKPSTFSWVWNGHCSSKSLDETIKKLLEVYQKFPESSSADKCCKPAKTKEIDRDKNPPQLKATTLSELLNTYGGVETPSGKRVLTQESFIEVDIKPHKELLTTCKKSIEITRGLLNTLVQIADDTIREEVRAILKGEVETLSLSIRAFSVKYPNNILDLLEAERKHYEKTDNYTQKTDTKRRKQ